MLYALQFGFVLVMVLGWCIAYFVPKNRGQFRFYVQATIGVLLTLGGLIGTLVNGDHIQSTKITEAVQKAYKGGE